MKPLILAAAISLICGAVTVPAATKPNIVVIVADDLGYADVRFNPQHPKEVATPNLDALAKAGVPHRMPPLGIMVEVPAVAIAPEAKVSSSSRTKSTSGSSLRLQPGSGMEVLMRLEPYSTASLIWTRSSLERSAWVC